VRAPLGLVGQHAEQGGIATGIHRSCQDFVADFDGVERIEDLDVHLKLTCQSVSQRRQFGRIADQCHHAHRLFARLILGRHDGTSNLADQRRGAILRRQTDGTDQRRLTAYQDRQVGFLGQHLHQQTGLRVLVFSAEEGSRGKGTQHEPMRIALASGAASLHVAQDVWRERGRQHAQLGCLAAVESHEIQQGILRQRRELSKCLETYQVGQLVVRHQWQLQDSQFCPAARHGDQPVASPQPQFADLGGQAISETRPLHLFRPNGKGRFDDESTTGTPADSKPGFLRIPLQC